MMNGVGTTVPLSAGGKYDRQIYMTNDGKLTFGTNTPFTTISSAAAYNDGQWHQVVASQGPAGMALYVDGARVAKNTVTTNGSYSGFWRIGGDTIAGYPNRPLSDFFGGNIDETAIYEKVLTPQQVADHYRLSGRTNPLVPAPPTDNYGAAVNADGPDLYWRLGEATGTIAVDTSNNNSTGTYAANVTRGVPSGVAGTADTAISTTGAATGIVYATAQRAVAGHLLRGALVQDRHHHGWQAHRVRQLGQRQLDPVRQAHLHGNRRPAPVRREQWWPPGHHLAERLQQQRLAPRGHDSGRQRHQALRRRRAGGQRCNDRKPELHRLLAGGWRQPRHLAEPTDH